MCPARSSVKMVQTLQKCSYLKQELLCSTMFSSAVCNICTVTWSTTRISPLASHSSLFSSHMQGWRGGTGSMTAQCGGRAAAQPGLGGRGGNQITLG